MRVSNGRVHDHKHLEVRLCAGKELRAGGLQGEQDVLGGQRLAIAHGRGDDERRLHGVAQVGLATRVKVDAV